MMAERGVEVDHTTIMRWVHQYSPEMEKKVRRYLKPTNDSWRVDETYIDRVVKVAKVQPA
jgi:transposase-like protein